MCIHVSFLDGTPRIVSPRSLRRHSTLRGLFARLFRKGGVKC
ncbi:MAG: hypothetical protein PHI85_09280 [Victivallaceae bacterium]|nr:hypothetical protein [Victivallaceae bacterium]